MYSENNAYNNKIDLRCILYKKDYPSTAYIAFRKFFNEQKHNHSKKFAQIGKAKIEARIKNESETSTLTPRDIYNKNINPEIVDISTFTENLVNHEKEKSKQFPNHSAHSLGF